MDGMRFVVPLHGHGTLSGGHDHALQAALWGDAGASGRSGDHVGGGHGQDRHGCRR